MPKNKKGVPYMFYPEEEKKMPLEAAEAENGAEKASCDVKAADEKEPCNEPDSEKSAEASEIKETNGEPEEENAPERDMVEVPECACGESAAECDIEEKREPAQPKMVWEDGFDGSRVSSPKQPKKNGSRIPVGAVVALVLCVALFAGIVGYGINKIVGGEFPEPTGTTLGDGTPEATGGAQGTQNTQGSYVTPVITPSASEGTAVPTGKSSIADIIVGPQGTITTVTSDPMVSILDKCVQSSVEIYLYYEGTLMGSGSGVIYTKDGYIITNYHVVSDTKLAPYKIKVVLSDGSAYEAQYVCGDLETDISVIKIEKNDCVPAVLGNSDETKVGEKIYAIGNSSGEGLSVTFGLISDLDRKSVIGSDSVTLLMEGAFLISAPINAGNSGGGVFNDRGELIGIVNSKKYLDKSGNAVDGMGGAIPLAKALDCINTLGTNDGYIPGRAKLGVIISTAGKTLQHGWSSVTYKAYVTGVSENSSAALAGVKEGDIITSLGGVNLMDFMRENSLISDYDALHMLLLSYKTGDKTTITVMRPQTSVNDFGYESTVYNEIELEITFLDFNYSK